MTQVTTQAEDFTDKVGGKINGGDFLTRQIDNTKPFWHCT